MRRRSGQGGMTAFSVRDGETLAQAGRLLASGRYGDAAALYADMARVHSKRPDLHNNLGVALKAAGRLDAAVASYRQAVKLDPNYGAGQRNLARALLEQGKTEDAAKHADLAWRASSDEASGIFELVSLLSACRFTRPVPIARRNLQMLLRRDDVDPQILAATTISLILADPRRRKQMVGSAGGLPDDPLLVLLLSWCVVPEPVVEAWITQLRRWLLLQDGLAAVRSRDLELLAAIACQCQLTEQAYQVSTEEVTAVEALAASIGTNMGAEDADAPFMLAAMYRPLEDLPTSDTLKDLARQMTATDRGPIAQLLRRGLVEPEQERALAGDLTALVKMQDTVSAKVRDQYEAHPYPRWRGVDRVRSVGLGDHLRARFPDLSVDQLDMAAPSILVAGCGTGRHAIMTAARYQGCQVLAIDLSRASLAYAARMAAGLNVGNITFAHGDLLELGTLEERFDLIECSGVLHHLADPTAGGVVLRGLLKPGGILRLALYSERARARFRRFQNPVDPKAGSAEAQIRARRAKILALPDDDPARILTQTADFYAVSGVRDALFHEQEVGFTPMRIAELLTLMQVDFLGFEGVSEPALKLFKSTGGNPADLQAWEAFEQDHPDTFIAMYQFWCRARE